MTAGPARYQAQALHSESRGVKTYLGVDPVTGLPVLIYRFAGSPRSGIEQLDSPFLPRILAFRHDDGGGLIVAAFSSAYQRAADTGSRPLTNGQLLDSARALQAAAALGVPHGSIDAGRFLLAGDSLLIEGFGVPWLSTGSAARPDGTQVAGTPADEALADDVRDWARTVSQLGYPANARVRELLQLAQSAAAAERPAAAELVGELGAALQAAGPDMALHTDSAPEAETFAASGPDMVPDAAPGPGPAGQQLDHAADTWDTEADSGSELPLLSRQDDWKLQAEATGGSLDAIKLDPVRPDASEGDRVRPDSNGLDAIEIDFAPSTQFSSERLLQQRQEAAVLPAAEPEAGSSGQAVAGVAAAAIPAISLPSAQRAAAGSRPSFVKDLPPGSTYRTGSAPPQPTQFLPSPQARQAVVPDEVPEPEPAGKRWRSGMIAALVILTIVLIGLALNSRGLLQVPWNQAPPVTTPLVTYIVDVQVEPADLPPVTLYVLESPAGSALRAGTIVGTAPRKIALDQPGNWVFEGRFQGQASGPVSIQVPEERNRVVLISMPPAPQD